MKSNLFNLIFPVLFTALLTSSPLLAEMSFDAKSVPSGWTRISSHDADTAKGWSRRTKSMRKDCILRIDYGTPKKILTNAQKELGKTVGKVLKADGYESMLVEDYTEIEVAGRKGYQWATAVRSTEKEGSSIYTRHFAIEGPDKLHSYTLRFVVTRFKGRGFIKKNPDSRSYKKFFDNLVF